MRLEKTTSCIGKKYNAILSIAVVEETKNKAKNNIIEIIETNFHKEYLSSEKLKYFLYFNKIIEGNKDKKSLTYAPLELYSL